MNLRIRIKKGIVSIILIVSMISLPFTSERVHGSVSNLGTTRITETTYKNSAEIKAKSVSGGAIDIGNNQDYDVTYKITSQWGNAFNADVSIKNTGNNVIDNWAIGFAFPYEITNIWNGVNITEFDESDICIIKNAGYNQDIPVGKSITFGFTASCSDIPFIPSSFILLMELDDVPCEAYQVDFKVINDWGQAFNGEILIKNTSNEVIEDWIIEMDFPYEIVSFFEGEIIKSTDNHYIINNAGYNANIKPGETLKLGFSGEPGNVLNPPNNIKLKQVIINTDRLQEDYDGDQLINVLELSYGTNPYNGDTDGDGIEDYIELMLALNPLKKDTDGNGIMDGNEDFDDDGLTVLQELKYQINNFNSDTDWDGLTDYEEIFIYGTDPLVADTDMDGLRDGAEIKLGLAPLDSDSDKNGIPDGKEKFWQSLSQNILSEEKPQITNVSVSMNGTGYINETTTIKNTYGKDMLSSGVVGLIGVPVDIETTSDFDEATITFTYDESLLGDTIEEDLRIMWYDDDNNIYNILAKETVLDTEKNTISYTTNHFSTYLVVDQQQWYNLWSDEIIYRGGNEGTPIPNIYYDICYVVDRSGSMSGSRIVQAKEALTHFVDSMHSHDRGAIIGFNSSALVYSYFNTGKDTLKNAINKITATGGTSVEAGLVEALNVFDKAPNYEVEGRKNSKIIMLLCDGDVSCSNATIERAKNNYIKIYTVLIGSTSGMSRLQYIAEETGGKFYYAATADEIRDAIWGVQEDTIGEIDKTDTDGDGLYDIYEIAGMRLPNGQIIYSNPQERDTDGDGLSDGEEMGMPIESYIVTDKYELEIIDVTFFYYVSNPNEKDSDFDNALDNEDATPLVTNEFINYIFYEKDGDWFLKSEAIQREILYKINDERVKVYPVNTLDDFAMLWNDMGYDGGTKYKFQIGEVVFIFHGSPNSICINCDKSLYLTTNKDNAANISIGKLDKKHINRLLLSSCNNGNIDFLNPITIGINNFTQNFAITFMKEMPGIEEVEAWDGIATYVLVLGIEYASKSQEFINWSVAKNGYNRKVNGKIHYFRNGSLIEFNPRVKKEVIFIYLPDNTFREINVNHIITEIIR